MKLRIASLVLVCLALTALPVLAQDLYDNGPANGNTDAWTINFGFSVTDSINVNGTVGDISFYAWLSPGDSITNVQVQMGAAPYGSELFNGFVALTQSNCHTNNFGFDVCAESGNFAGPTLAGSAWLTLQNANLPSGDPVYWDENSGVGCTSPGCPSSAQENTVGSIPSEAFTVSGTSTTTPTSTPEPSTFLLLGSGILGLGGLLRRRLF